MRNTSTVCAPCRLFSGTLFGIKHSQIVPLVGVGENYLRWGQLEYLEHCSISIYALRGIGTPNALSRFCTADIACTSISVSRFGTIRVHTCLCSRGSAQQILSLLSVFGPSQYPQYFSRQYSNTLSIRTTICSRAFYLWSLLMLPWASRKKYFGGIYVVCAKAYSAGHKVL